MEFKNTSLQCSNLHATNFQVLFYNRSSWIFTEIRLVLMTLQGSKNLFRASTCSEGSNIKMVRILKSCIIP